MDVELAREAVAAVLADFGRPDVAIGVRPDDELVELSLPGTARHSTRLEPWDRAHVFTGVALALQNDANFWLDDGWGEPLPRCPGHQHPPNPEPHDGDAWWVCPATRERVARIGELAQTHESPRA